MYPHNSQLIFDKAAKAKQWRKQAFQQMVLDQVYACLQVALVMSDSSQPYGPQPARLLSPQDSSGKNAGVGCHALLQGVFLTQGLNPRLLQLLHCRQILYC